MLPWTGIFSVLVALAGFSGSSVWADRFLRIWARILFAYFGIRVLVEGEENLPHKGGGIIVFNHQSHFDIPALILATRKTIRFGAKIELFKIPIFGAAMRAVGTLPIARDNRSQTMKVYQEAAARFTQGTLFVLAPEGSRQSQPEIGRFKKGPFLFAANAGVPLLPTVIKGAHAVLAKHSLTANVGRWHREIVIRFLAPVSPGEDQDHRSIEVLAQNVRAAMVDTYKGMPELM